ncbi:MAG: hypothetical protein ABII06_06040 [Pseudomonadota bacterium]
MAKRSAHSFKKFQKELKRKKKSKEKMDRRQGIPDADSQDEPEFQEKTVSQEDDNKVDKVEPDLETPPDGD